MTPVSTFKPTSANAEYSCQPPSRASPRLLVYLAITRWDRLPMQVLQLLQAYRRCPSETVLLHCILQMGLILHERAP